MLLILYAFVFVIVFFVVRDNPSSCAKKRQQHIYPLCLHTTLLSSLTSCLYLPLDLDTFSINLLCPSTIQTHKKDPLTFTYALNQKLSPSPLALLTTSSISYSIVAGICHHHICFANQLPYPESGTNQNFSTRYCPDCRRAQDTPTEYVPYTAHSIIAGVCHYHIRYDARLPFPASGFNQDFSNPYCPTCLHEQAIIPQHAHASDAYHQHGHLEHDDPDRYGARRRLDHARIDLAYRQYNRNDRARALLDACPPALLSTAPPYGSIPRRSMSTRSITATLGSMRAAARSICRGGMRMRAVRGNWNTSNPGRDRREARRRERGAEEGRRRRDPTPHPGRFAIYEEEEEEEEGEG
ncbi:hypothetical protein MMC32_008375 [Xylographa parallela]|nr:hypothetical protein [Xylographa parallela]